MNRAIKIIRKIPLGEGLLMDQSGNTAEMRFDLTETQDFVDDVPGVRKAFGILKFNDSRKGSNMLLSTGDKILIGSGIQAEVIIVAMDSFRVTGSVAKL
jgi:hypothetical protein